MFQRSFVFCALFVSSVFTDTADAELLAGAAVVDISPTQMPVIVNGGMLTREVLSLIHI